MKGEHPKRRKDKYNPYKIFRDDQNCYISFSDSQGIQQEFKISEQLYETLNQFELGDLRALNEWDRHIDRFSVLEEILESKRLHTSMSVEDIVIQKMEYEKLQQAIMRLPDKQKRRLIQYFFEGKTYEQIADEEGCTKMPVKRSINEALSRIKKFFEKN